MLVTMLWVEAWAAEGAGWGSGTEVGLAVAAAVSYTHLPRSWWHPVGAMILSKQFSARSPNLCNAVALTFTIDREKFATPLEAWAVGVLRSADFMESFRKKYGPTEYFIGLEFHKEDGEGEAWPHWHCILLRRGTYPQALLEEMWGLSLIHI